MSRLLELDGTEEQRVITLAAESSLHPWLIWLAVAYAEKHPEVTQVWIDQNRALAERQRLYREYQKIKV